MRSLIFRSLWFAVLSAGVVIGFAPRAGAQLLFSEGFNYTAGSNLGANAPWGGSSGPDLKIGSSGLTYGGYNNLAGNGLILTSGAATSDTNIFSASVISSGSIYFSFLVDCTTLPTANNYMLALNPATASPGGGSDVVSIYAGASGSGWKIGVRTDGGGSGAVYYGTALTANQTYLIAGEYTFGTFTANLYVDPVPGNSQPGTVSATQTGTTFNGGIQNIGLKAQSATTQGNFDLDDLLVGDTWTDVTPVASPEPSTLAFSALGAGLLALKFRRRRS